MGKSAKICISIALISALCAGSYAYLNPKKSTALKTPKTLTIIIGKVQLRLPENLIRDPEQRINGTLNVLNIAANWPDFSPLITPNNLISAENSQTQKIFMTIEAADDTIAPEQRPTNLYSRFLTTDITDNQNQLITRIFKAGSPYTGEVLHIAPPNGEIFSARCQLTKTPEVRPEHCLWQLRTNKLDVSIRFSEDILSEWQTLNSTIRTVLENIIVKPK